MLLCIIFSRKCLRNNNGIQILSCFTLQSRTGTGQLNPDRANSSVAGTLSRGFLPVNPNPPAFLDYTQAAQRRQSYGQGQGQDQRDTLTTGQCRPRVRDQGVCSSCSAQATVTALEYCLCLAGEGELEPRSVQQVSECTNGKIPSSLV